MRNLTSSNIFAVAIERVNAERISVKWTVDGRSGDSRPAG